MQLNQVAKDSLIQCRPIRGCWHTNQQINHMTRLGCFYVSAILSWGYGWGWVEVDIEAEVEMKLDDIESKFS